MRINNTTVALVISVLLISLQTPAASAVQVDVQRLAAGAAVAREIAEGETHPYHISLKPGEFLKAIIFQRTTEVRVKLSGPDGQDLGEMNNRVGFRRPHRVVVIASAAGDYRLDISVVKKGAPRGSYEVQVAELRPAGPADERLVLAERSLAEGGRLVMQQTPDSMLGALEKYRESLALFQSLANPHGEAEAQAKICEVHFLTVKPAEALECLNRSVELWRSLGDKREEAQAITGLASLRQIRGDLYGAMAEMEKALSLQREAGDRFGEGQSLNNLGVISSSLGEIQKALEFYEQGVHLAEALGDRQMIARFLGNRGTSYSRLGDSYTATAYYEKAVAIFRDLGLRRAMAGDLDGLGVAHLKLGNVDKALACFKESLALARETGDRRTEMVSLLNTGGAYSEVGDFPRALEHYDLALETNLTVGDRRGEAFIRKSIGVTNLKIGELDKARQYLLEALAIFREIGDRLGEASVLTDLAQVDRDAGKLTEGLKSIEEAVRIADSTRRSFISPQLRARFRASSQTSYETHVDLLMRLHETNPGQKYDAAAMRASEGARGRVLVELLNEARVDIRRGIDPALLDRERTLRQQLNAKEVFKTQMSGRRLPPEQLAALDREIAELIASYDRVQEEIRTTNPRYAALRDPPLLTTEQIQQLLDPGTLLLEYSLGEKRSYLWAVTDKTLSSHVLPPAREIDKAARRVYELLTARNQRLPDESTGQRRERIAAADRDYRTASTQLSRMLLGPVAEHLGARRLAIAGEGPLQLVPFGALPHPKSSGSSDFQPLVAGHEIVVLSSASQLTTISKESRPDRRPDKVVAVLADPVFDAADSRVEGARAQARLRSEEPKGTEKLPADLLRSARDFGSGGFRRLRSSRVEADAIAALSPAGRTLKAVDFAASRSTATDDLLSQYRIVHFATHGLINTQHPELSGLVLSLVDENGASRDGFLRLHEIYNMDLNADLVVLSSCQSALGKDIQGEGLVGLTRGFMYAGATQVAASLWSVEDQATAELMKRFYKRMLGAGMKPAAALRAAQLELRKEKQWSSPYHWAGFVIMGDWR